MKHNLSARTTHTGPKAVDYQTGCSAGNAVGQTFLSQRILHLQTSRVNDDGVGNGGKERTFCIRRRRVRLVSVLFGPPREALT